MTAGKPKPQNAALLADRKQKLVAKRTEHRKGRRKEGWKENTKKQPQGRSQRSNAEKTAYVVTPRTPFTRSEERGEEEDKYEEREEEYEEGAEGRERTAGKDASAMTAPTRKTQGRMRKGEKESM